MSPIVCPVKLEKEVSTHSSCDVGAIVVIMLLALVLDIIAISANEEKSQPIDTKSDGVFPCTISDGINVPTIVSTAKIFLNVSIATITAVAHELRPVMVSPIDNVPDTPPILAYATLFCSTSTV